MQSFESQPVFQRNVLPPSSQLKRELNKKPVRSNQLNLQWTTQHYIPEYRSFHNHCCENLGSCKYTWLPCCKVWANIKNEKWGQTVLVLLPSHSFSPLLLPSSELLLVHSCTVAMLPTPTLVIMPSFFQQYCGIYAQGKNCEASRGQLPRNDSANTPIARQQIRNTQQWSNWEAVFSPRPM
jgi:hypothetical protein